MWVISAFVEGSVYSVDKPCTHHFSLLIGCICASTGGDKYYKHTTINACTTSEYAAVSPPVASTQLAAGDTASGQCTGNGTKTK